MIHGLILARQETTPINVDVCESLLLLSLTTWGIGTFWFKVMSVPIYSTQREVMKIETLKSSFWIECS